MFNAVSVATGQNAEISNLFDANHQRLSAAQRALSELLESSEDGYELIAYTNQPNGYDLIAYTNKHDVKPDGEAAEDESEPSFDFQNPPFHIKDAVATWARQSKYLGKVSALHLINHANKWHFNEHIPCPVFFDACKTKLEEEDSKGDKYREELEVARREIQRLKASWVQSKSCAMLTEAIHNKALEMRRITKIIGFGLGTKGYQHWFGRRFLHQYLAIQTIVETLEAVYKTQNPDTPPIALTFQERYYKKIEKDIFEELYQRPVNLVEDPHGCLELDANSLVFTCCLPIHMPLLQIITDMFWYNPTSGPAGLIIDKIFSQMFGAVNILYTLAGGG